MPDTRCHDAALQRARFDRARNAARFPYRVDGAHLVLVPAFRERTALQINADGRPEERVLNIVKGERVSAKEETDEAPLDQLLHVRHRPAVDDRRTGHDEDFTAIGPRPL